MLKMYSHELFLNIIFRRGHKHGGGIQKDHIGGGLVWVQICPRGLFTAPYSHFALTVHIG